jgi:hypothetical protein
MFTFYSGKKLKGKFCSSFEYKECHGFIFQRVLKPRKGNEQQVLHMTIRLPTYLLLLAKPIYIAPMSPGTDVMMLKILSPKNGVLC